jgi:RNA polymerase sigma factor (sigma-70 family)
LATSRISKIVPHLRRVALLQEDAGLTDGQLLESFLACRDEAAFAALVRRHGPMVLGVCRRVLPNPHDAEDAFQATFLVLVRKGDSVVPRDMVANWLYGVARTTAHRARVASAKRAGRERQVVAMPEPEARHAEDELWRDLQPVLDQELSRLPDKYRVPILLCDLEGKSIKEAARHLGWPQGTLAGRLARARALLAKRLTRHGLAVSAGALAAALSQNASAAGVPAAVAATTVRAATVLAAGQAVTEAAISAEVASLMEGVMKTMLLTKLKTMTLLLLAAALVGGAGLFYRSQAAEAEKEDPPATRSQASKEESPPEKPAAPATSEPSRRMLVPGGVMPRQALVRMEKGQLAVQTSDVMYEPVVVRLEDRVHTSYQKTEILRTRQYELDMIKVYDMRGRSINKKELSDLLKKERLALISNDAQVADPDNLRLFKEGTLLFILPLSPPAVGYPASLPQATAVPAPLSVPVESGPGSQTVPQYVPPPPTPVPSNQRKDP